MVYFFLTSVLNKKKKNFPSVFIYDVIIRRCKNFVPSLDLAWRGLLSWTTKWISLSPEFLPLQDLPPSWLRAFLCHREVRRTAARPQRHRFFLRKGIRMVYQMISLKIFLVGQNYVPIRRINAVVLPAIYWAICGVGACFALLSKSLLHLIGSGAEHL